MKPILEDAIKALRLVLMDCQSAHEGGLRRCESAMFQAVENRAKDVISKYEAERRREEPSLQEVCRVMCWLERVR